MTTEQLRDQEGIIRTVSTRIRNKYSRGQAEHGGNLWERPALPELVNETTDLNTYLVTLERQLRLMAETTLRAKVSLAHKDLSDVQWCLDQLDAGFHAQLPS